MQVFVQDTNPVGADSSVKRSLQSMQMRRLDNCIRGQVRSHGCVIRQDVGVALSCDGRIPVIRMMRRNAVGTGLLVGGAVSTGLLAGRAVGTGLLVKGAIITKPVVGGAIITGPVGGSAISIRLVGADLSAKRSSQAMQMRRLDNCIRGQVRSHGCVIHQEVGVALKHKAFITFYNNDGKTS